MCGPVDVDDAVMQVNVIAGNTDQPLHQIQIFPCGVRDGLDEHNDVTTSWFAIVNQGKPLGRGRQGQSVNKQMIANQQCVFH